MKQPPLKSRLIAAASIPQNEWKFACHWAMTEHSKTMAASTRVNIDRSIRQFDEWLAGRAIHPDHLQEFVNHLHADGYAPARIKLVVTIIRKIIKRVERTTGVPFLTFVDVKFPPEQAKERTILTPQDYQKISDACKQFEERVVFALMWHCGLACVDACLLKFESVRLDQCMIVGFRGKTQTEFRIPFDQGSEIHRLLEEAVAGRARRLAIMNDEYNRTYLLPDAAVRYRAGGFRDAVKSIFKRSGVVMPKGELSHAFRRTYCTAIANSGMHPSLGMKATGHSSFASFHGYVRPDDGAIREGISKAMAKREIGACNDGPIRQSLFDKTNQDTDEKAS
jgi:integrase